MLERMQNLVPIPKPRCHCTFPPCLSQCLERNGLDTYTTVKMVTMKEPEIACVHKVLMFLLLMVGLVNLMIFRSYCEIVPIQSNDYALGAWWEMADWEREIGNLQDGTDPLPGYCTGEISTDTWYDENFQFINNTCNTLWRGMDVARSSDNLLSGTTFFGHVDQETGQLTTGEIVPLTEHYKFGFTLGFLFPKHEGINPETHFMFGDYNKKLAEYKSAQKVYYFTIQELLDMVDEDLNNQNVGPDAELNAKPDGLQSWPMYRISGIEFVVELDVSNLKHEEYPLDETLRNMITVKSSSMQQTTSNWACEGPGYKRNGGTVDNFKDMKGGHECNIKVRFVVGGDMCVFSASMLMGALANLIVFFGLATTLVDVIGGYIYHAFKQIKIQDGEDVLEDHPEYLTNSSELENKKGIYGVGIPAVELTAHKKRAPGESDTPAYDFGGEIAEKNSEHSRASFFK